jgi:hypothetical protein
MTQLNPDVASIILEFANYFKRAVLFDILFPGSRRLCYKRNIKEIKYIYGTVYVLFGKLHSEEDLPASIKASGDQEWYFNNKFHRGDDKPAKIYKSGGQEWWFNGSRHRNNDLPAIISAGGTKQWYINGKRHRDNYKPAIIWTGGYQEWFCHGARYHIESKLFSS